MAPRGKQTISQRISLDGGAQIKKEFLELGAAGEKAFNDLQRASNRLNFGNRVSAQIAQMKTAFSGLQSAGSNLGESIQRTAGRIALVGTAAAAAAGGLALLIKGGTNAADELGKTAQKVGVSIKDLQGLQLAGNLADVDKDQLKKALVKISGDIEEAGNKGKKAGAQIGEAFGSGLRQQVGDTGVTITRFGESSAKAVASLAKSGDEIQRVGSGIQKTVNGVNLIQFSNSNIAKLATDTKAAASDSEKAAAAYKKLGVNLVDSSGKARGSRAVVLDLANAISKLGDGTEKVALLTDIFGERIGPDLATFFNGGSKAILEADALIEKYGIGITELDNKNSEAFNDSLTTLGAVTEGFRTKIAALLAPLGTQIAGGLTEKLGTLGQTVLTFAEQQIGKATPYIEAFVKLLNGDELGNSKAEQSVRALADNVLAFGRAVVAVSDFAIAAFEGIKVAADGVASVINGLFGTNVTGGELLLGAALLQLTGAFGLLKNSVLLGIATFKVLDAVLGPIARVLIGGIANAIRITIVALVGLTAVPGLIAAAVIVAGVLIFKYWDEIKAGYNTVVDKLKEPVSFEGIKSGYNSVIDFLRTPVTLETIGLGGLAKAISDAFAALPGIIEGAFASLLGTITGILSTISSIIDGVISRARAAASAIAIVSGGGDTGSTDALGNAQPFASGGRISGPGTGTSDSILARFGKGMIRVSNGEYIVREKMTRQWLPLLEMLNSGRLTRENLSRLLAGFSGGGRATLGAMRDGLRSFAEGGLASLNASMQGGMQLQPSIIAMPRVGAAGGGAGGQALSLYIGNDVIRGLTASPDAIEQLSRHASRTAALSMGTPGWKGR